MSDKFEMVIVDGVRYRPEDVPKKRTGPKVKDSAQAEKEAADKAEAEKAAEAARVAAEEAAKAEKEAEKKAAEKPANKSRTVADK